MGMLKAKVDGAWVEVGSGVGGVPAGGSAGQILTKTSAADYATAWTSTPPILANNTFLQGYKADGTTAQTLIGMTTADEISIGSGLAAGKNVVFPSTVSLTNDVALATDKSLYVGGAQALLYSSGVLYLARNTTNVVNDVAGGTTFSRDVAINGTLYKGGVAYTHPDYILESWATGRIEKFLGAPGARDYIGLRPLPEVEEYIRQNWRLPGHARDGKADVFRQNDETLASVEEAFLYLIDLAHRLSDHEKRLAALEGR